jgi:hypothetical protein
VSTCVIIIVVILLAVSTYKALKKYEDNKLIAIKTSQGLIKINADSLATKLSNLHADLSRHGGYERTSKFDLEINEVLEHVKNFIEQNPHDKTVCNGEIKASIINNALGDRINSNKAYDTILSHDDLEYGSDSRRFDYLLRHIDILVNLLKHDVCDGGLLDVSALENILRLLDDDLTKGAAFDEETYAYGDSNFSSEVGMELVARANAYAIPKLSLFGSQMSQLEGFNVEAQLRANPAVIASSDNQFSIGPQNVRNVQQRSQMFHDNNRKIGLKHYVDEDLLFTPTYDSMAL